MVQICLITYKKLNQLVNEALQSFSGEGVNLFVVQGLRNEILEKEKRSQIERADVIIAGGANARIARENFRVPVLEYKITEFDHMSAIQQGMKYGKRVAVVTYRAPVSHSLISCFPAEERERLVNLIYEDTEELCRLMEEHAPDVVVGAAHAVEIGEEMGKRTVLIYPGVTSILESIKNAVAVAMEIRKERKKNQFLSVIMENNAEGVILTDQDGTVLDCSRNAAGLCSSEAEKLRGARLQEILPELGLDDFSISGEKENSSGCSVRGQELFRHMIRLEDRTGEYTGAVIFLAPLKERKEWLENHRKDQRTRAEKGFHAKRTFSDMIGSSDALRASIEDARFFSRSDSSLLLYGETGVGKEVFAQSIHNYSPRKNENFIAINCAALPENLLESELFGYDEGAFTGGRKGGKKGLFELADRGTIFLDEIGEISPSVQSRLLRVLQEKEIMHVGGDKIIPVDVRVISATNKNFETMSDGQFRKDLLYRLSVLELTIPPLRERGEDAAELFEHFCTGKKNLSLMNLKLSEGVKKILKIYSWPGNIRELQNVCERFCIYLEMGTQTGPSYMKTCLIKAIGEKRLLQDLFRLHGGDSRQISPELVLDMKDVFSYNREQIANILGVSRTTIWRMMKN